MAVEIYIFFAQVNNNSNKKNKNKNCEPMGSTRPNPIHVGWVGLGCTLVMGWIFFGWVEKSSQPDLTRPMHIHNLINKLISYA